MTSDRSIFARYGAPMMVAMNLVWGGSYLVADIGLKEMSPTGLAAWRFLIATVLLVVVLLVRRTPLRIERRDLARVILIGGVSVAGSYILTYHGILLATSTDRAVISPLEPVALAIMGAVFLRERLRGRQWAGIVVACIGAYMLVARNETGVPHARQILGLALMLLSFFTEGVYSIAGKPLLIRYRPLTLTVWAMFFATVILFAAAALGGGLPPAPPSASAWWAVLFLAVPCSVIGYTLWYLVLEHRPAGEVGVFIFLQPVVGIFLGMRYRGESVTTLLITGTLLVIVGVWLTSGGKPSAPILDPEPSA
jgi:drug/metabolite transporter (DMT)-like permease